MLHIIVRQIVYVFGSTHVNHYFLLINLPLILLDRPSIGWGQGFLIASLCKGILVRLIALKLHATFKDSGEISHANKYISDI